MRLVDFLSTPSKSPPDMEDLALQTALASVGRLTIRLSNHAHVCPHHGTAGALQDCLNACFGNMTLGDFLRGHPWSGPTLICALQDTAVLGDEMDTVISQLYAVHCKALVVYEASFV